MDSSLFFADIDEDFQDEKETDKEKNVGKHKNIEAILELFERKKQELDNLVNAEDELQYKLKNLKVDRQFDEFFEDMNLTGSIIKLKNNKPKKLFEFEQLDLETGNLKSSLGSVDVEKEMLKSVLQPGIEKEHSLPRYHVSQRKLKALKKKERESTKGPEWYNLPAPEVTKELKNDLQILKMRSVLDPKHFYKKNDMKVLPKYFQLGRIMDSPLDHVSERIPKKNRKRTMVEELLADAEFQKYNKRKYKEIVDEKRKTEYRTFMKDKRQKNKAILKKNKLKSKTENKS